MVLLDAARPCGLCLAQRVSSRAIFVGVLLILTTLFTIEAVAQAPTAPTGLRASSGDGQVTLSWTAVDNATGYRYIHKVVGTPGETNGITVDTTVSITGLTNGTSYKFWVQAVDIINSLFSPKSSPVTVTPMIPAPTGLRASSGDGQVTLSWTAPSPVVDSNITYDYIHNGISNWLPIGSGTSGIVPELDNGIQSRSGLHVVMTKERSLER